MESGEMRCTTYPDGKHRLHPHIRQCACGFVEIEPTASSAIEVAPQEQVCSEILSIMRVYHEQEKSPYGVDTPGGLGRMGDVWRLFQKWERMLTEAKPSVAPGEQAQGNKLAAAAPELLHVLKMLVDWYSIGPDSQLAMVKRGRSLIARLEKGGR